MTDQRKTRPQLARGEGAGRPRSEAKAKQLSSPLPTWEEVAERLRAEAQRSRFLTDRDLAVRINARG